MEGIMMRNRSTYAVALRQNDGSINIEKHNIKDAGVILKIPFVRGVYSLIQSLKIGMGTLMESASVLEDENEIKDEAKEKRELTLTLFVAIILAVGIFVAIPYILSRLLSPITDSALILNGAEGVVKFIVFLGYMVIIGHMEEIHRVYMYHGAEHKCINCIENGLELTVENVRESSRLHKRCGTSFLFIIIFLSIIFHIFIMVESHILQVIIRLLLVPVIAGVAYEFIRLAGRSENPIVGIFSKPGLMIQRLTTAEPTDDMIEIGIASVEAVFDWRDFQGRESGFTVSKVYMRAKEMLEKAGIEDAPIDAGILMEYLFNVKPEDRHLNPDDELGFDKWQELWVLLRRRIAHEPLAQITGETEFYGYKFFVTKDVLCPRQDTELIVEKTLEIIKNKEEEINYLDMCTGSGAILLSVVSEAKKNGIKIKPTGCDISSDALGIARKNAKNLGIQTRLLAGDMFGALPLNISYDIITANPPYISENDMETLMPEVKDYEPRIALFGGEDGLDFYRNISKKIKDYLNPGGHIIMEIGCDQGKSVPLIFKEEGFTQIKVHKDLAGNDRAVVVKYTD